MPKGGLRINAGRPGWRGRVEECRRLDARELQKAGVFKSPWRGSWFWRDAHTGETRSTVAIRTTPKTLSLSYCCNKTTVSEVISLERIACGFGGQRVLLNCPGCTRRVHLLYLRRCFFRCRSCHELTYRSQREDEIGRTWLAQVKLEGQLGSRYARPKGMHQVTFKRLRQKIFALEMRRDDLIDDAWGRWA